jgi:hypothetical protein
MSTETNKAAVFSLISALLGICAYVASNLVLNFVNPETSGFLIYLFGLFGLGGVLALIGLILGIMGIRKLRLKVLAVISTIICSLILIAVVYSGIMMIY